MRGSKSHPSSRPKVNLDIVPAGDGVDCMSPVELDTATAAKNYILQSHVRSPSGGNALSPKARGRKSSWDHTPVDPGSPFNTPPRQFPGTARESTSFPSLSPTSRRPPVKRTESSRSWASRKPSTTEDEILDKMNAVWEADVDFEEQSLDSIVATCMGQSVSHEPTDPDRTPLNPFDTNWDHTGLRWDPGASSEMQNAFCGGFGYRYEYRRGRLVYSEVLLWTMGAGTLFALAVVAPLVLLLAPLAILWQFCRGGSRRSWVLWTIVLLLSLQGGLGLAALVVGTMFWNPAAISRTEVVAPICAYVIIGSVVVAIVVMEEITGVTFFSFPLLNDRSDPEELPHATSPSQSATAENLLGPVTPNLDFPRQDSDFFVIGEIFREIRETRTSVQGDTNATPISFNHPQQYVHDDPMKSMLAVRDSIDAILLERVRKQQTKAHVFFLRWVLPVVLGLIQGGTFPFMRHVYGPAMANKWQYLFVQRTAAVSLFVWQMLVVGVFMHTLDLFKKLFDFNKALMVVTRHGLRDTTTGIRWNKLRGRNKQELALWLTLRTGFAGRFNRVCVRAGPATALSLFGLVATTVTMILRLIVAEGDLEIQARSPFALLAFFNMLICIVFLVLLISYGIALGAVPAQNRTFLKYRLDMLRERQVHFENGVRYMEMEAQQSAASTDMTDFPPVTHSQPLRPKHTREDIEAFRAHVVELEEFSQLLNVVISSIHVDKPPRVFGVQLSADLRNKVLGVAVTGALTGVVRLIVR